MKNPFSRKRKRRRKERKGRGGREEAFRNGAIIVETPRAVRCMFGRLAPQNDGFPNSVCEPGRLNAPPRRKDERSHPHGEDLLF